jgi:glycosyltransferase involved in cell wall biosynthesis
MLLVICADVVGPGMAGTGIRSYELSRVLAEHTTVTLAAPEGSAVDDVELLQYDRWDPRSLRQLIARADCVVAQPQWPALATWLRRSGARLIYDLYTPEPLELLELLHDRRGPFPSLMHRFALDRYLDALRDGDHFICASEKQRDLWLGMMLAERVIDQDAYERDPSLRGLIDLVPFGVPAAPPGPGSGARAHFGLPSSAEIVLWNGGIWSWLDAPCAIRAVARLAERRRSVRLVFMGTSHGVAGRAATEEARDLARDLGLLDRVVFFNEGWTPYAERAAWLLEAACVVSTHLDHLETRFAFRTRLLDCFWAGVPVVATRGDELAEVIDAEHLGATVDEGDDAALADALEAVLSGRRDAYAAALERIAAAYRWDRVAQPLVRFATLPPGAQRRQRARVRPPARAARAAGHRVATASLNSLRLRKPLNRALVRSLGGG